VGGGSSARVSIRLTLPRGSEPDEEPCTSVRAGMCTSTCVCLRVCICFGVRGLSASCVCVCVCVCVGVDVCVCVCVCISARRNHVQSCLYALAVWRVRVEVCLTRRGVVCLSAQSRARQKWPRRPRRQSLSRPSWGHSLRHCPPDQPERGW